jgi:prepilin-type N-terminal cleavage/methylation domain-containing protein
MKKLEKIKFKGFTFLELILVIAIIGIMSATSIVSLGALKVRANLKSAQSEVSATIETAKSYALQGKKQNGNTACGYGFRFKDNKNYEIFYNKLSLSDCATQNANNAYLHHRASSISVFSGKLVNNVTLSSPASNFTEIFFTIPHANVYNNTGSIFNGSTFVFQANASNSKKIVIDKRASITSN